MTTTLSITDHEGTPIVTDPSIPYEDGSRPGWRQRLAALLPAADSARLHIIDGPDGRTITNLIRTTNASSARRAPDPGSCLVTTGMVLLAALDAGLLYVVFAAQQRFIFAVKHQHAASVVQALSLDVAMIIFSVLALGLARRGLPASAERGCIVLCACVSAFMNWTASDQASPRSVAVFVSAPLLLALVTDRVVSALRRHVLGMREDASVWARLGRQLARAALYLLRLLVDFRATRAGVCRAILAAAPLPGQEENTGSGMTLDATAPEGIRAERLTSRQALQDLAARLENIRRGADADTTALAERLGRLEPGAAGGNGNGHPVYPTKKAHLLAMYRARGDYGRRETAGRAATELAGQAGLQASTARAYIYQELSRLDGQGNGKEEAQ